MTFFPVELMKAGDCGWDDPFYKQTSSNKQMNTYLAYVLVMRSGCDKSKDSDLIPMLGT
jgi:hypothetical protein